MNTMTMTKLWMAKAIMKSPRWQKNHTKRVAQLYVIIYNHEDVWLFFCGCCCRDWRFVPVFYILFSYREIKTVHRASLKICKLPHFSPISIVTISLIQFSYWASVLLFKCSRTISLLFIAWNSFFLSRCFFPSLFIYFVNLRFRRHTVNACCIYELLCFSI